MALLLDQLEDDLLVCLCSMLAEEERPVCACHKYAGESRPPADRCGINDRGQNGQAWLRRDESEWQPNTGDAGATWGGGYCGGSQKWSTPIELGIYRCIQAIPPDERSAPGPELYDADRDLMKADRATLARLLCCPVWEDSQFRVVGASIVPIGPSGACGGSMITLLVEGDVMATDEDSGIVVVAPTVSGPAGWSQ